ncbi:MAG: NAD(P)-dependent oxidoreductase, partial [Solirubrobacteraceae bacterium]
RCAALGMRVLGVSSAPREVPGFELVVAREQLASVAGEVDFLVLLTPYTAATRRIVDARVLGAMRPSAYLINVARGGVIDEEALVAALASRRIAGAALDVFETEPLPVDSPLWTLENVLITPHIAGFHVDYPDDALPIVEENVRRYLDGRLGELVGIVRLGAGVGA